MSHRFEKIAQDWLDKEKINEEAFQEFMENEEWRKIKIDTDNPNMNFNNISPACQKCIFSQVQKYNSSDESNYNKFSVPCTGIPKHYVSDEILNYLKIPRNSPEAKEMEAARNPVVWAQKNCINEQGGPWVPREGQDIMLECTSKRLVFRCGRRFGKCMSENSMILTPYGNKPIKDFEPGDLVYAYNIKTNSVELVPVIAKHDNGIREVVELIHNGQVYSQCTSDHKWLTCDDSLVKQLKDCTENTLFKKFCINISSNNEIQISNADPIKLQFGRKTLVQTYDLEINTEDHLYLTADGLVTHNSDALAILMLFYAFTQPFYARDPNTGKVLLNPKTGQPMQQQTKILCITPRQTHADNLMDKVFGFLERNPVLGNSVLNSKKSPYYIMNFTNKSRITCLTAGTGTASSGVNIRSFSADIVIMDEGNYLGDAELEATKAILMTNTNTMLRISSTPKGTQDFFWEMCFDKPEYKEFHFPSVLLPHWELVKRNVYADVNTEDEFLHEYMAEFSASSEGVFRMDLVQQAMHNYDYKECRRQEGCVYSIGVDWGSTAGTEIFVIEANPATGMYKAVYSENVPKSEWTQLNAIERLIRVYRTWKADVVCVDEGHGHGAIEIMKKYSLEHGRGDLLIGGLRDKLLVYNFSSKIQVADPINGRLLKKHAKPFLVQTSVRRFEESRVMLSTEDKVLKQQIAHYEVYSVTEQGIPKYRCSKAGLGDHRLDAFMLAVVGLKLKFGHLDRRSMAVTDTGYISGPSIDIESRTINLGRNEAEIQTLSNMDYMIRNPDNNNLPRYNKIPSRTGFSNDNNKSRQLKGIHERKPLYNQRQSIKRRNR